jgi:hypothetical protein
MRDESSRTSEPEKPGIGFGDRRANMIGLLVLGLTVLGFIAGLVFLVVMIVKK